MSEERAFRLSFGSISNLLGLPLRQVDSRWMASLTETLAPLKVTPARAAALFFIEHNPGCSQATLGQALRINRPSTAQAVDQLQAIGAVERRKASVGARNNALYLTPEGEQLLHAVLERARAQEEAFFARLTTTERERLRKLLLKLL